VLARRRGLISQQPKIKTMKIKSIEEELADCRAAFAQHPNANLVWMCHHEVLIEPLIEPFENRINYILINKPENERAVRLRNFRPVKNEAAVKLALEAYKAAVKPALEAYNTAVKPAREAYYAAVTPVQEAYDAAVKPDLEAYLAATKPDLEAYLAATKPALEAYNTAVKPAEEVYWAAVKTVRQPLIKLLNQEYPDNTWNGKSIFNK
jgi:hypothetical protein